LVRDKRKREREIRREKRFIKQTTNRGKGKDIWEKTAHNPVGVRKQILTLQRLIRGAGRTYERRKGGGEEVE